MDIIINVAGGVVQEVLSRKNIKSRVFVVDTDTEYGDPDKITHALDKGGADIEAYVYEANIQKLPKNSDISRLIMSWEAEENETP